MWEQYSGGGNPFQKKKRIRLGDDLALEPDEYQNLSNAVSQTPIDQIPQKRDFFASPPSRVMGDDENPPMPVGQANPSILPLAAPVDAVAPTQPDANDAAAMFAPQAVAPPQQTQTSPFGGMILAPPNPYADRRAAAEAAINNIQNKEYGFKKDENGNILTDADGKKIYGKDRDKDHNWWDSAKSALLGALQGFSTSGLGGAIGGAITGGIGGAVDRNYDEKLQDQMFRLPQAQARLQQAQQAEEFNTKQRAAETQMDNIRTDNQYNQERLDQQRDISNTNRADKILAKYQKRPTFDASKATPAEIAELKSIGKNPEDLGTWDRTRPDVQKINGHTFVWDNSTRTFKESGLPIDEEKNLVDFKTKDGATYRVSAKTAASLQTQFDTLGIRQDFQQKENEKDRQLQLQKQQIANSMQLQLKAIEGAQRDASQAKSIQARKEAQDRQIEAQKEYIRLRAEAKKLEDQ